MTTQDPHRLFESEDVPATLRGLLQRAHEDALPEGTLHGLIEAAERQAAMPAPLPRYRRCASWSKHLARRSTQILLAAAIMGAGVGAWYGAGGKPSSTQPVATETQGTLPKPAALAEPPPQALPAINPSPTIIATTSARPAPSPRARAISTARTDRGLRGPAAPVPEISPAAPTQGEEFRVLRDARQALAPRPELALKLTDEHVRLFPNGMLTQEREAIAIEALVALGREGQARLRSRAFLQSYPSSPYRGRVERALDRAAARP